jgi:uncharacterized membrane protein YvlD (DUF360 family)
MGRILITGVISAVILWLLSFLPFMHISFGGGLIAFLLAAAVIGLINALIVPAVKSVLGNRSNSLILLIISLVIDAAALWLAGWLAGQFNLGFSIEFFPTAIIAAAVLAVLNVGVDRT